MTWTDQKIQMLKDMWGNHSASEIAEIIGGLTRNAVIGKAHRLKLSVSKTSDASGATRLASAAAGQIKSARKRVMLRPLPVVPNPAGVSARQPIPASRDIFRTLEGIGGVVRNEGIAVTKAGDRHCRWPVGDPRSPDFRFCGCTAHEGLPYCVDHARVAYQNVGKRSRPAFNEDRTH